ncbi:cytochrome P450 2K4-like, partial [Polyodon spathula]|uniref:cytochrome P450 2K4-like n=1 Tax=Polyodon spathula TaxID=7913 RepID=UPI001B7DE104
ILFGKGESWKVMRRFTLSTLRDFGMGKKTIEDQIIEESQRMVEVFQSHKGKPFDPQIIINSAVSNIICSIVFGDRFDYSDSQFLNLQRIVNENVRLGVSPKTQLYNMFPFLGFFLSDHKKAHQNGTMFQGYFRNIYKDLKDTVDSNDLRSFIDTFISRQREEEARNSNKYFHEDNMAITSGNLFAAGTETTSTTLRWGLLLMMKYPHIQALLHGLDAPITAHKHVHIISVG